MTVIGTVVQVPAAQVRPGSNDRTEFDPTALAELAASIQENGLAQPPTIRPAGDGYEIVAGERRVRAMVDLLGWVEIPAIVRDLDDLAASRLMLAENVSREDLDPIEEALAYKSRMDRYHLTVVEVAKMAGVSWNRVDSKVCLLRCCPEAQHLIRKGQLAENVGWALGRLDSNRQVIAMRAMAAGDLTATQMKAVIDRLQGEQDQEQMFNPDDFWSVEDYVAHGREHEKITRPEQMRRLLRAMAAELGADHHLSQAARELVGAK